jgi:hypothetical protein
MLLKSGEPPLLLCNLSTPMVLSCRIPSPLCTTITPILAPPENPSEQ